MLPLQRSPPNTPQVAGTGGQEGAAAGIGADGATQAERSPSSGSCPVKVNGQRHRLSCSPCPCVCLAGHYLLRRDVAYVLATTPLEEPTRLQLLGGSWNRRAVVCRPAHRPFRKSTYKYIAFYCQDGGGAKSNYSFARKRWRHRGLSSDLPGPGGLVLRCTKAHSSAPEGSSQSPHGVAPAPGGPSAPAAAQGRSPKGQGQPPDVVGAEAEYLPAP